MIVRCTTIPRPSSSSGRGFPNPISCNRANASLLALRSTRSAWIFLRQFGHHTQSGFVPCVAIDHRDSTASFHSSSSIRRRTTSCARFRPLAFLAGDNRLPLTQPVSPTTTPRRTKRVVMHPRQQRQRPPTHLALRPARQPHPPRPL